MKKFLLPIFILTWTLVLSGLWLIRPGEMSPSILEYLFVGFIVLYFMIGIYFAIQRKKRKKQGLVKEEDLSGKVTQKAAAISFYISLILWVILIYMQSYFKINMKWIFSSGMIGMAVIFVISWMIINRTGLNYEE